MSTVDSFRHQHEKVPPWFQQHSGLFLAAFKKDFNYDLVSLYVPLLAIAVGATPLQLGFLGVLQRAFYILGCPLVGHLSDRWSRKGFAVSGAILFACIAIVLSRAKSLAEIFWAVPGVGLTLGLFWPSLQGWLS